MNTEKAGGRLPPAEINRTWVVNGIPDVLIAYLDKAGSTPGFELVVRLRVENGFNYAVAAVWPSRLLAGPIGEDPALRAHGRGLSAGWETGLGLTRARASNPGRPVGILVNVLATRQEHFALFASVAAGGFRLQAEGPSGAFPGVTVMGVVRN